MSESVSQLRDMKFEEARLTTFQAWPSNAKVRNVTTKTRAGGDCNCNNFHNAINTPDDLMLLPQVEAWKMAKAGLFHTGNDEEVKCTWCGCLLNNWQYGDQVK